jgi:diguanylate cyclase (GGDEF)-like protein
VRPPPTQGPRILVADDDAPTRALMCEAFQGAGYDVRWAASGPEVHRLLDTEAFEAVVTDLVMPGMEACDLVRSLCERANGAVIVLVTGYPSADTAIEAVHGSVWEYITKPFDLDALVACVQEGIHHERLQRENRRLVGELQAANRKLAEQQHILERRVCQATASLQTSNEALRRRVAQLGRLNELSKAVNEARTEDLAVRQIAAAVLDLIPADYCGVLLPESDGSGQIFEIYAARPMNDAARERIGEIIWDALEVVAPSRRLERDRPPVLAGVRDPAADAVGDIAATLSVQLAVHGEVLGILSVGSGRPGILTDEDHRLLSTIGSQAAAGLESIRSYAWVQSNYLATVQALAKSLEAKDPYTSGHSSRVAAMAVQIAETMRLEPEHIAMVRYAATLHDIGKIGVDDSTIRSPKRLTARELESVRRHPQLAEEILRPVQMLRPALPLIRHHHERWDGGGYPDGIAGEQIPLGARIIAVADAFDAMTSNRPYRDRQAAATALREIHANAGTQFDPEVVLALLALRPEEPLTPAAPVSPRDASAWPSGPDGDASDGDAAAQPGLESVAAEAPGGAQACVRPARTLLCRCLWLMLWLALPCALSVALLSAARAVFTPTVALLWGVCAAAAWEARRSRSGRQVAPPGVPVPPSQVSPRPTKAPTELDWVTGLLNRGEFERLLRREAENSVRLGRTLSLVMLDVDRLKLVNDRCGHTVGDAVLRAVAAAIQGTVRATDLVARYGGDEIVVIAPDTDLAGATQLADRIRVAVEQLALDMGPQENGLHVTISAGVASSQDGGGVEDLLSRADQALYNAKAGGRNQVRVGRDCDRSRSAAAWHAPRAADGDSAQP